MASLVQHGPGMGLLQKRGFLPQSPCCKTRALPRPIALAPNTNGVCDRSGQTESHPALELVLDQDPFGTSLRSMGCRTDGRGFPRRSSSRRWMLRSRGRFDRPGSASRAIQRIFRFGPAHRCLRFGLPIDPLERESKRLRSESSTCSLRRGRSTLPSLASPRSRPQSLGSDRRCLCDRAELDDDRDSNRPSTRSLSQIGSRFPTRCRLFLGRMRRT